MFCKHEWKVISETTTKSELDMLIAAGAIEIENVSSKRKFIQVISCDKCGKLKRFVEDI